MTKTIGGIFLIVGISIGAGILALPVTTAPSGFLPSLGLLLFCWVFMTFNAFLILEVNLWLPAQSNMISMAKATIGRFGQLIAWVSYCALLYALLSAYIAAGTDVLNSLLTAIHFVLPHWLDALIFAGVLAAVVYRGTKSIDYVNRGLIFTKLGAFALLLIFIAPHIQLTHIQHMEVGYLSSTLMVMITSFGFASIVPSLRSYFDSNVKQLRTVILVGSLIPLLCYIAWVLVILGSLPLEGDNGLLAVLHSGRTTSALIRALNHTVDSGWVTSMSTLFSSICVVTSFLGVALSLSDFLFDGLHFKKSTKNNAIVYSLTFIPPLLIVLFYPAAFIKALAYAGTCCVILLALLPNLMVWRGRYHKKIARGYQVFGGKKLLIVSMALSLLVLAVGVSQEFGLITMQTP